MEQRVAPLPSAGLPIWLHDERILAYSWLLVLLAAPIIIALLVWFRVLLKRRHELTRSRLCQDRLVSASAFGSTCGSSKADQWSWPAKECAASSTASSSSSTNQQPSPLYSRSKCETPAQCTLKLHKQSLKSLVNHTSLYLASLAWQQIFACCMALLMAVLNLLRARNLLACNLVIFPLISGKLLSLFSLSAFAVLRLTKLVSIRRGVNKRSCHCCSSASASKRRSSRQVVISSTGGTSTSNGSSNSTSGAQDELSSREAACQQEARLCESTTTHRLISTDANPARRARPGRRAAPSSPTVTSPTASRWQMCQSWLLILLSVGLAAVYLYLRLMNMVLVEANEQLAHSDNKNSTSHLRDTWQFSADASSRPSQVTGYYSADGLMGAQSSVSRVASKPGYLRQLASQYELESFMRLLLSRQFVTSRFTCTLAAANYVPAARISAMLLYASLMLVVLAASLASQLLSRTILRHFVPADDGQGRVQTSGQSASFWPAGDSCGRAAELARWPAPRRRRVSAKRVLASQLGPGLSSTCSTTCSHCSDASELRPASQPQFRVARLALANGAASMGSLSSLGASNSEPGRSARWNDVELGCDKSSSAGTSNEDTAKALQESQARPTTGASLWSSPSVSQQDLCNTFGWLMYAELRRDLKLSQSVILFGQLLDHAPILVSTRLACRA